MSNSVAGITPSGATAQTALSQSTASAATMGDASINKGTFLQLLVAQIKNQNPMNPADGVEFLTQLAQFSQLEQIIQIRQDVETIRKGMVPNADSAAGTQAAAKTQTST